MDQGLLRVRTSELLPERSEWDKGKDMGNRCLARLLRHELPMSQRSQELTEQIMLREQTAAYSYSGKAGWVSDPGHETGWFVGDLTRQQPPAGAWTFALRIEAGKPAPESFGPAREAIAKAQLRRMGLLD